MRSKTEPAEQPSSRASDQTLFTIHKFLIYIDIILNMCSVKGCHSFIITFKHFMYTHTHTHILYLWLHQLLSMLMSLVCVFTECTHSSILLVSKANIIYGYEMQNVCVCVRETLSKFQFIQFIIVAENVFLHSTFTDTDSYYCCNCAQWLIFAMQMMCNFGAFKNISLPSFSITISLCHNIAEAFWLVCQWCAWCVRISYETFSIASSLQENMELNVMWNSKMCGENIRRGREKARQHIAREIRSISTQLK